MDSLGAVSEPRVHTYFLAYSSPTPTLTPSPQYKAIGVTEGQCRTSGPVRGHAAT